MAELPNAPVKRLLTDGSQGLRVSASALELSAEHVSNLVRRLGQAAGQVAARDGRKTIMDGDVNQAWAELVSPQA